MGLHIEPKDIVIPEQIRTKWQRMLNILIKALNIPVALIMKVNFPSFVVFEAGDSSENPFKKDSKFTLPAGIYCEKTMQTGQMNVVVNAIKDPEWNKNPSIPLGLIAYCGVPIFYPDKNIFGTLCILDKKENSFPDEYREIISLFKEMIEMHLEFLWQKEILMNMLMEQRAVEKELRKELEKNK